MAVDTQATSEQRDGAVDAAAGPRHRPAAELAALLRRRELSATEVAETYLERIERHNPALHAFLTVDAEQVRAEAAAADRALAAGEEPGPLHGVPVAVKDLEVTRGLRTTFGAGPYADHVPEQDSIVVERLREAGAVVLGKTNTPAFGLLGETKNRLGADARNPWDLERTTGGSSGGSAAAVATDLAPLATGTDSAGSITCPAGMCGVVGIKPTHGRVPVWPDAGDSLTFNDAGPLARTVADAALLLRALAGHDPRDPVALREPLGDLEAAAAGPLRDVRIAFSPDLGHCAVDAEVASLAAAAAGAFAELGHEPVEATPQTEDPWRSYMPIYLADAQVALADYFRDSADDLYPETVHEIAGSERITGADVARAWNELRRYRAAMAEFFTRHDLLLTPATAVPAFPCGEPPSQIGGVAVQPGWRTFMPLQIPWNMTGQPVACVPAGLTDAGLPVGLQIVGPLGREDLVVSAAAALERLRPAPTPPAPPG